MKKTELGFARVLKVCGLCEDEVRAKLKNLLLKKEGPTVTVVTRGKEVQVLLESSEATEEEARQSQKPVLKEIKKILGDSLYSKKEGETLEEAVVRLLLKHELTVTTAESCTGGMIASRLVNVPGVSEVFNEGFITYSNKAKRKILDVSKSTLKKYGAVSEQTAREMAIGGVFAADADACIAVTGIAGPDGGTAEKPVGLVYAACCIKDDVVVEECHFTGTRAEIREQTADYALNLLRRSILKNYR